MNAAIQKCKEQVEYDEAALMAVQANLADSRRALRKAIAQQGPGYVEGQEDWYYDPRSDDPTYDQSLHSDGAFYSRQSRKDLERALKAQDKLTEEEALFNKTNPKDSNTGVDSVPDFGPELRHYNDKHGE